VLLSTKARGIIISESNLIKNKEGKLQQSWNLTGFRDGHPNTQAHHAAFPGFSWSKITLRMPTHGVDDTPSAGYQ
jgi:hypothetical protein